MSPTSYIVFSGGTACNHIARTFHDPASNNVCYVLGISDNGGSSSELLRVLGGPSMGDLRSRLTRLIDIAQPIKSPERAAVKELLSYRLPADASYQEINEEWMSIVEGRHSLWKAIPIEKRETIRGFLTSFHFEVLKRAHKRFNFRNGSIGNFFLTGARLFFGSLEAAVFLFSAITGISDHISVVPVINTNQTATIAARLANGDTLTGQNEISHPPPVDSGRLANRGGSRSMTNPIDVFSLLAMGEDTSEPLSPSGDYGNLVFSKDEYQNLAARIERIYYINQYGQEIYPFPNPKVIHQLSCQETLIYSIGSLYTSIVPCLILRSIGNAIIESPSLKYKILLLNGTTDRETPGYTAVDFIHAITSALNQSRKIDACRDFYDTVSDVHLQPNGAHSSMHLQTASLSPFPPHRSSNVANIGSVPASPSNHYPPFPDHLFLPSRPSAFITHLVYLDNSAVHVDVDFIEGEGIKCVCIQGARSPSGDPIYDDAALANALRDICASSPQTGNNVIHQ